jgi:hypothetical protein
MPEYAFTGVLTLSGVTFVVVADDKIEARAKAKRGQVMDWDTSSGTIDCMKLDPDSCELCE